MLEKDARYRPGDAGEIAAEADELSLTWGGEAAVQEHPAAVATTMFYLRARPTTQRSALTLSEISGDAAATA